MAAAERGTAQQEWKIGHIFATVDHHLRRMVLASKRGGGVQLQIDIMGVLTGVFPERQYEKGGKMTIMVVIKLTDPHGKLECALFGEYDLRNFLQQGDHVQVRNSIVEHGVIDVEPLAVVFDNSREGLESDFMKLHPKKQFLSYHKYKSKYCGHSDGPWFYLACKCNHSVTLQSIMHFCENCQVPVLQVSPRIFGGDEAEGKTKRVMGTWQA